VCGDETGAGAGDPSAKPLKIKAHGVLARVLQHEIDHLDGVLYLDRLTGPDKLHKIPPREVMQEETDMVG